MLLASADNIIISNPDVFTQSDFVTDFLRVIGWKGIKGLRVISKGIETLFDAVYDFLNITNSGVFQDFYNNFRPLIVVGLVVSLIVLGLIYMLSEKRPEVLKNFIVGLMVVFATPTFIQYLNEAIFTSKMYLSSDLSSTDSVISSNITDLLYLDSVGWDITSGSGNSLDTDAISHLNPSEHVNRKNDVSSLGQQIFDTQIIVKSDGKIKSGEMGVKGWFDMFDPPYYYRYNIHYFQIAILLIIFCLVIIFASYKSFLLIYEIMNSRIVGSLVAMDLTSGQKVKKVIEGFFSAYFSLFYILVSLKLYALTQAYINAQSYGPIVRTCMLIFAGFLVMDGPNLIEKIFGYDIGLGSGAQKFMSLMRLGMEGMQLKYYAQNMGLGGAGKGLSNMASAINEKLSFGNSKSSNAPEPPKNPNSEGSTAYSAPEPNTSPSGGQNYNASPTTENHPGDMQDRPNDDNGPSYNSGEPPMSGSGNDNSSSSAESNDYLNNNPESTMDISDENIASTQDAGSENELSSSGNSDLLNNTDSSPQEPGQNNNMDMKENDIPNSSTGYSDENIASVQNADPGNELSGSGNSDVLNNTDSSPQEPGQNNDKNMQGNDTHNSSSYSDRDSKTSSNDSAQGFSSGNLEQGNEAPNDINNNSDSRGMEEANYNSSSQEGSKEPGHDHNHTNSTINNEVAQKGKDELSNNNETKAAMNTTKGEDTKNSNSPNAEKIGATNSTSNNSNSDLQQNSHGDIAKEQLMDRKFGTESISPNIISAPDEPGLSSNNKNDSSLSDTNTMNNGFVAQDDIGANSKHYSENDPASHKDSLQSDGTVAQDRVGVTPLGLSDNSSALNKDAHHPGNGSTSQKDNLHSGGTVAAQAQDNSGVTSANHKGRGSISYSDNLQSGGAVAQDNSGVTQSENRGNNLASYNGNTQAAISDSNVYSSTPEGTGLQNENLQSGAVIPIENLNEGLHNTDISGFAQSNANLKISDAMMDNNVSKGSGEPGEKQDGNAKNLKVTDVLNTPTPELPKGNKAEKSTGTRKTGKKSTEIQSKGVDKKK